MIAYPFKLMLLIGAVGLGAFALSYLLIVLLRPLFVRHALAQPNARSSHREPTPQGGGLAVVAATLITAWAAIAFAPDLVPLQDRQFAGVTVGALLLALIGGLDDIRALPASVRLIVQLVAVGLVVAMLPKEFQVVSALPQWLERLMLVLTGLWFVNLVNFMDGIDWMTVAETVPLAGAVMLLALYAGIGVLPMLLAAALLGATLGFAPFNKPVARLFLGDVGSLPIGLLLGWLLLQVAGRGHLSAALLLPLYYLADATITLGRRLVRGERIWEAHRSHFYQRALDGGFTVREVVARVAGVNVALAVLALLAADMPTRTVRVLTLVIGALLVGWLLLSFARGKRR
jgi:UDP-N-acetylmuramyl pentapeptide phosphotransferase/UDP-N-acetylglucosamine-1-phosphate transferase